MNGKDDSLIPSPAESVNANRSALPTNSKFRLVPNPQALTSELTIERTGSSVNLWSHFECARETTPTVAGWALGDLGLDESAVSRSRNPRVCDGGPMRSEAKRHVEISGCLGCKPGSSTQGRGPFTGALSAFNGDSAATCFF
jgi:hypothetical protein